MADEKGILDKKLTQVHRAGEERDAKRAAGAAKIPYVDLRTTPMSIDALALVSEQDAREARVAAIEKKNKDVALAVHDPVSPKTAAIQKKLAAQGYSVKVFIASLSGLEQVWSFYKYITSRGRQITGKVEISEVRFNDLMKRLVTLELVQSEIKNTDLNELTTAAFFEIVLAGALANRTSDIHLEAEEHDARLRYRIDGYLHNIADDVPLKRYTGLMSRIKLLGGLKINVRGEAQDGRFTVGLESKEVEIRVSIIPSEFGETVVMRILDPDSINLGLADLGMRADDMEIATKALSEPNGLILNTGPTGSGKTTTLYAFLRQVSKPDIKIITIEDPIEYHLPGIEQTQTNPDAGYTFVSGLRAILRQDPDVILVGEIRDKETAEIAFQSSLTGHLVFSTLHTNDAIGAVPRLVDLGVKPVTIGPALTLVIAQRLVRRLCPKCKVAKEMPDEVAGYLKKFLNELPPRVDRSPYAHPTLFEPAGCAVCNHLGFRGRIGIMEFFEVGPEFEKLILEEVSEVALLELAKKQQMVTMQQDGIMKAITGITTFHEVEEATGPIKWK